MLYDLPCGPPASRLCQRKARLSARSAEPAAKAATAGICSSAAFASTVNWQVVSRFPAIKKTQRAAGSVAE